MLFCKKGDPPMQFTMFTEEASDFANVLDTHHCHITDMISVARKSTNIRFLGQMTFILENILFK